MSEQYKSKSPSDTGNPMAKPGDTRGEKTGTDKQQPGVPDKSKSPVAGVANPPPVPGKGNEGGGRWAPAAAGAVAPTKPRVEGGREQSESDGPIDDGKPAKVDAVRAPQAGAPVDPAKTGSMSGDGKGNRDEHGQSRGGSSNRIG